MPPGSLAIVLHAHLPFVRHAEQENFLEEDWLHHAIVDCYAPLLDVLARLAREHVPFRVTMSFSPTLCAMLRDPLLSARFGRRLDALIDLAARAAGDLSGHYVARFSRVRALLDEHKGDLLSGYAGLEAQGHLELCAVPATHAILPLLSTPESRRAQIRIGMESHRRHFGREPRGMWLAECAWDETLDEDLVRCGVGQVVLEAEAFARARPRPAAGLAAPVRTRAGLTAFARDPGSSTAVWSATEGYPGDPAYREFHRDLGWDAGLELLRPLLSDDGLRRQVGIKLHRVTGLVSLSEKLPYDPEAAARRAVEHARHFLAGRARSVRRAARWIDHPVCVAPFDAELFGHWWYEGPLFLDALLRLAARSRSFDTVTLSEHLDRHGPGEDAAPAPSTWGEGGDLRTWLNEETAWMLRPLHEAEEGMVRLARLAVSEGPPRRALTQAGRELLLTQASDWAFLIRAGTSRSYAERRVREHLAAFAALHDDVVSRRIDEPRLAALQAAHGIFPWLDASAWS
jgi:1,4-alpha-glucan branching enzyme